MRRREITSGPTSATEEKYDKKPTKTYQNRQNWKPSERLRRHQIMKNPANRLSKTDQKGVKIAESYAPGRAAALLGVSKSTLKKMYESGQLQGFHTPGGTLRIFHHSIEHLKAERASKARSPRNVSSTVESRKTRIEDLTLQRQEIEAQDALDEAHDKRQEKIQQRKTAAQDRKEERELRRAELDAAERNRDRQDQERYAVREQQEIEQEIKYAQDRALAEFHSRWFQQIPYIVVLETLGDGLSDQQREEIQDPLEEEITRHGPEDEPQMRRILNRIIRSKVEPILTGRERQKTRERIANGAVTKLLFLGASDAERAEARKAILSALATAPDVELEATAETTLTSFQREVERRRLESRVLNRADNELPAVATPGDRAQLRRECLEILHSPEEVAADASEDEAWAAVEPTVKEMRRQIDQAEAARQKQSIRDEILSRVPVPATDKQKTDVERPVRRAYESLPKDAKPFEVRSTLEEAARPGLEAIEQSLRQKRALAAAMAQLPPTATKDDKDDLEQKCIQMADELGPNPSEAELGEAFQREAKDTGQNIERRTAQATAQTQKRQYIERAGSDVWLYLIELHRNHEIDQETVSDVDYRVELTKTVQGQLEGELSGVESPERVRELIRRMIYAELKSESESE
jgi:hypothetical protein